MIYKFMTTNDNAEIVHSELKRDDTVMVYVEKPDIKDGFHHLTCILPSYSTKEVFGFSEKEVEKYMDLIKANSHLIIKSSKGLILDRTEYYLDREKWANLETSPI